MSDPSESPGPSSVDVLAAKRTHRPNPLNHFQVYTGGWNFTNMNYLAVMSALIHTSSHVMVY